MQGVGQYTGNRAGNSRGVKSKIDGGSLTAIIRPRTDLSLSRQAGDSCLVQCSCIRFVKGLSFTKEESQTLCREFCSLFVVLYISQGIANMGQNAPHSEAGWDIFHEQVVHAV